MENIQAIDMLRCAVNSAGTATKWAEDHGFSTAYVSDILHGRRAVGPRMLTALGLEKVVSYRVVAPITKGGQPLEVIRE
jgi:hypothetical protein